MATEMNSTTELPYLQSVQRAMALPTVGAAIEQVGALYSRVKGAHSLLEWALSTTETTVSLAATGTAHYFSAPIGAVDARVDAALAELERRVPLVTEPPKVILDTTKKAVLDKISPHVAKVCGARAIAGQRVKSLKELSWAKANALLSTAYGKRVLEGVDTGAALAHKLLDQYLPPPPVPNDEKTDDIVPSSEIVSATADPALHTAQTVGRLSSVAARRLWGNLAWRVRELKANGIDLDPRRYLSALLAALHLTNLTEPNSVPKPKPSEPKKEQ